jgi:hypothetical protein
MAIDRGVCLLLISFFNPLLTLTADSDLPYCGSDDVATGGVAPSITAMVKTNFSSVETNNFSS